MNIFSAPLALLLVLGTPAAAPANSSVSETNVLAALAESGDWKASSGDNIAGISDLKKISNPATVDYTGLLAATTEMKELKRDRIDPESAKGRSLRQLAADRVTKASEAVRKEKRHCSVWKAIAHADKRKIPDITKAVKDKLGSV